jgi:hypothetical protein
MDAVAKGRMEVVMPNWSEWQGVWDGEALEDGYEGSGQAEASMWEAELEAMLEAESAGGAEVGQTGHAGRTGNWGEAGEGFVLVDAAREEEGPSPS